MKMFEDSFPAFKMTLLVKCKNLYSDSPYYK